MLFTESSCTNSLWYSVSFSKTTPATGGCTTTAECIDMAIRIIAINFICFVIPITDDIINIELIE